MITAIRPSGETSRQTVDDRAGEVGSLVVFSDDWGRHPSSCQHLVRCLSHRFPVVWINTIGTRAPRLDAATFRRAMEKIRHWSSARFLPAGESQSTAERTTQPVTVLNPRMWPWFSRWHDRRLNRWLLQSQLSERIAGLPRPVIGLTTLPITADLPDVLNLDRWVYYCVDDFSEWPGLDRDTLRRMDQHMLQRADAVVTVSTTLQQKITAAGRTSVLLTHGIDPHFWNGGTDSSTADSIHSGSESVIARLPGPRIVFWGVIDRRMDTPTLSALARSLQRGSIILVGPQQDPDPELLRLPSVITLPACPMSALPAIARDADVLIMPYADLPVTRSMQPLKLKEYLATGKPVVVNRLPATADWEDCLDTADSPGHFANLVAQRSRSGVPEAQLMARRRLAGESWQSKAEQLLSILRPPGDLTGEERTVPNSAAEMWRPASVPARDSANRRQPQ